MSLLKWFGDKAQQARNFFSTTYNISKTDKAPESSPEIMRVLNKFASIFMDAEIEIRDQYDKVHKSKSQYLNKLLGSDPLYRGKSSFLSKLCKVAILDGGAIVKKTVISGDEIATFDLLEPRNVYGVINYTKSRLSIVNFRELFSSLKYSDYYTGKVINLALDDVNFFVDNTKPGAHLLMQSRLAEIQGKINNSYYANNMLSSLLNRCSIVFLSRENKSEYTTLNTTGLAKERTKNFNEAYHVNNSAVVPIGDNMKVLDTSVNARATGVFDSFTDTISAACNLLGITRTIIDIQDSTFSNQEGAMKDAIQNGVQSFANRVADFLTEILREHNLISKDQHVYFDYSEVLKRNLADTVEDVERTEATEEQPETETTTEIE